VTVSLPLSLRSLAVLNLALVFCVVCRSGMLSRWLNEVSRRVCAYSGPAQVKSYSEPTDTLSLSLSHRSHFYS
jgi:hypothetical protein